ncbi:MAG TPA: ABC transporter ATP-binding protein [Stellaceae bacterium]|nr:ABC transporter ATP-binding protein [Stellaceae bacterium]
MISLDRVSKSYRTLDGRHVVLADVSAVFPDGRNIGIMGANGSGKSTLIRLLAGSELPDRGRISRDCRVSFPLGFGGTFHGELSGHENVAFLARIYGEDVRRVLRFVDEFSELGEYFRMPVNTYSSGMRAKLAFGASLAMNFDVYLIDEVTVVGDAQFQERCRAAFESRIRHADVIMVSHSFTTIQGYCDAAAILEGGRLTMFDELDDAIEVYRMMMGITEPAVEDRAG